MTTSLNPRLIAVAGIAAALGLAAFMYLQVGRGDDTTATPQNENTAVQPAAKPAKSAVTKIVLLPGLPGQVAGKLQRSKVVVVTVYQGATPDDLRAISSARKGARSVGAGFLAVNLANEKRARALAPFVGDATPPTLVVVKRPGTIVTRLTGPVDSDLVAQAAFNAGARRR